MTKYLYPLLFCLVFGSLPLAGQVFPVTIQQTISNVPEALSSIPTNPNTQWSVALQLLDPNEASVQVVLRLKIEGAGVRIQSRGFSVPVVHTVNYGAPLMLDAGDLGYLLDPANLAVEGISQSEFVRQGTRLPEGIYTYCIEAFLLNRPDQAGVSNESCSVVVRTILEPPTITYPIDGQSIPTYLPQNFAVQWQTNSPALEAYELSIIPVGEAIPGPLTFDRSGEVISNAGTGGNVSGNVQRGGSITTWGDFNNTAISNTPAQSLIPTGEALNLTPPLFNDGNIMGLQRVIGPAEPPLVQGQWYLARVRAFDPLGTNAYRNGGWSLPVLFQYGEVCHGVSNATALPVADTRVRLTWAPNPQAVNGYRVYVRNRTLPAIITSWYEVSTTIPSLLLDRLEPNTRYEYVITSVCSGGQSAGSSSFFSTPRPPNVDSHSGDDEGGIPPTVPGTFTVDDNGDPYNPQLSDCTDQPAVGQGIQGTPDPSAALAANATFTVSNMTVRAVKPSGSGGTGFSGEGTILIAYLEQGAIAVDYANVQLDANRNMVAGTITAKRGKEKIKVNQFNTLLGEGEECSNYTERQLDDRGFGANGLNYITGTQLDPRGFDQSGAYYGETYREGQGSPRSPRGFDADGMHSNGTRYDDNGCNRDSLNQYGQPCVWRAPGGGVEQSDVSSGGSTGQQAGGVAGGSGGNGTTSNPAITPTGPTAPGPATVEGTNFYNSKGDAFWKEQTKIAVDTMLDRTRGGVFLFNTLAGAGSLFISGYISVTGLDRAMLVGDNDELLEPGMSRLFPNGMPKADTTGREPSYQAYEAMIHQLYQTDRYIEDTLKPLEIFYETHQTDPELEDLTGHVIQHVKALNSTELATLQASSSALMKWVRERVATKGVQLSLNPNAGYGAWINPAEEQKVMHGPPGSMIAALQGTDLGSEDWSVASEEVREASVKDYINSLRSIDYDRELGFKLPIKIEREIAGKTYAVYIDDLKFGANGTQLDAFMVLPLPGKDEDYVVFKGDNIAFSGEGIIGEGKLGIANKLDIGMGSYGTLTFPAAADNFVTFDCQGYTGFELTGEFLFCRDKVIPLNADGTVKEAAANQAAAKAPRVKADINIQGTKWLNFLVSTGVSDKFAVRDLRDVWWEADGNITIDFSRDTSSTTMVFPDSYASNYVGGGHKPTAAWQGIHIPRLNATVDVFEKRRTDEKLSFLTQDLFIDDTGLTIHASAQNLLTLDEGHVGSWSVGVDSVDLKIFQGAWKSAAMRGAIRMPTSKTDTLGYLAQASQGGYFDFGVSFKSAREFSWDAWDGTLTIQPNSSLTIGRSEEEGWFASTKLYGKMNLGLEEGATFKAPDIVFDDFQLATYSPYIGLGVGGRFGITDMGVKIKDFSIEITEFSLIKPPPRPNATFERLGLRAAGSISLMGSEGGFGVAGGADVIGYLDDSDPDDLDIKYDTTKINDMFLSVKAPGVFIAGGIRFFDESFANGDYGSGFQGLIDARFDGIDIGVSCAGMFGSMPPSRGDYRYWFVDAGLLLGMPTASIPIVGALHLTGIGGGASYHMARSDKEDEPVEVTFGAKPTQMPPLGQTLSGLTLVPSKSIGLGLRLMTSVATYPSPQVMNGNLLLGADFTSSWGINSMIFFGSASVASPTKMDGTPIKGANPALAIGFNIEYLHRDRTISGGLHTWVNYPPVGVTVLKGRHGVFAEKDGYVGQVEMLISPAKMYMWAGRPYRRNEPDRRLGLKTSDPFEMDLSAYFAYGSELPPPAQIPLRIWNKSSAIRNMNFDLPKASSGIAFGAELDVPPKDKIAVLRFLPDVPYSISFLAGFNVMLASDMKCNNKEAGLNGWFAAGNVYVDAFVRALGFGLGVQGAAIVSGPNPFYAAATFRIINPIRDFDASADFGKPCKNQTQKPPPPVEFKLPFANNELIVASSLDGAGKLKLGEAITYTLARTPNESFFIDDPAGPREFRIKFKNNFITTSPYTASIATSGNTITLTPPRGGWKPGNSRNGVRILVVLQEKKNNGWSNFKYQGRLYKQMRLDWFETVDPPTLDIVKITSPVDESEIQDYRPKLTYIFDETRLEVLVEEIYGAGGELVPRKHFRLQDSLGNDVPIRERVETINGFWRTKIHEPVNYLKTGMRYAFTVRYEARYKLNGGTSPVRINGRNLEEADVITFTVAPRPRVLTSEHVALAYPEPLQYNTYPEQTTEDCFVKFNDDLTALLGPNWIDSQNDRLFVRYRDNVTQEVVWSDGVEVNGNTVKWNAIPSALLGDHTYQLELYLDVANAQKDGQRAPTIANRGRSDVADGGAPFTGGDIIYIAHFRVSTFATFSDKINDIGWAAGASRTRRGVMSPTYWDTDVYDNYGDEDIPYKVDMTTRDLGVVGYREAVGLTELFSRAELEGRLAIEVQPNSYFDQIARDYLNYSIIKNVQVCTNDLITELAVTIEDGLPQNTIYLMQGIPGPVLSPTSGHGIGTEPLLSDPQTEIFPPDQVMDAPPHEELDGRFPGIRYDDGGLNSVAPLVLVNDFHRKVVEHYNTSWLYRSTGVDTACDDYSDLNANFNDELDHIVDKILDHLVIDDVLGGLGLGPVLPGPGGGLPGIDGVGGGITPPGGTTPPGGNGPPPLGGDPLVQGGNGSGVITPPNNLFNNSQVIIRNGGSGMNTQYAAFGQTLSGGNSPNFSNDAVSQNINTYNNRPWGGGFTTSEDYLKRLSRTFLAGQNILPKVIPSPMGRSMPVKIAYRIPKIDGSFDIFYSTVIDTQY